MFPSVALRWTFGSSARSSDTRGRPLLVSLGCKAGFRAFLDDILQHPFVQTQVRNKLRQPSVLGFELLKPPKLAYGQTTVLLLINRLPVYLAEREGFEPSVRCSPYTRFPGVHLKPLGHLSVKFGNQNSR